MEVNVPTCLTLDSLPPKVKAYVDKWVAHCKPASVHVCDGSPEEDKALFDRLVQQGTLLRLSKLDNCFLCRTKKADVARVEKRTFICSHTRNGAKPTPKEGIKSKLGHWKDPDEMDAILAKDFDGCMKGRVMYVIPYCMGPLGSDIAKIGIQCSDSTYVVVSMRKMTRMGKKVLDVLGDGDFVRCLHSVGVPLLPGVPTNDPWPCCPDNITIAHFPHRREIKSFGSGYGGNSLLGKKCFALRIASTYARDEGWLAEHMLILGLTSPKGVKKYIAAAFPSQCGKTNLAMITPGLPGWKAELIGDDIAWMRFGPDGRLWAINPENGLFGVATGTNMKSNPNAMGAVSANTIYTNVALTADGGVFWEGLEEETPPDLGITSWLGVENWQKLSPEEKKASTAAHPNSRFCTPTSQCPNLDPDWENPKGVPIDAILFGGRRPKTIPLVFETFNWEHAIYVGLCLRSQATAAAADHKGKKILLNDPFAMRPFFGYNICQYMDHWQELKKHPGAKLPKVFHVNWFREDQQGHFIWPGFGENIRVLDWVLRRCDGEDVADKTPLGYIPKPGTINIEGLGPIDMEHLFDFSKAELEQEVAEMEQYFDEQMPGQLPAFIQQEIANLKARIAEM